MEYNRNELCSLIKSVAFLVSGASKPTSTVTMVLHLTTLAFTIVTKPTFLTYMTFSSTIKFSFCLLL